MMQMDDIVVNFPCPDCKVLFPVSLRQMKDGGVMVCPTCKLTNAGVELSRLEQQLEEIGTMIQNVKHYLDNKSNSTR